MTLREVAVNYAWTLLGDPYLWGGDDFAGRDCSGQVQEILAAVGLDPSGDQTADGLYRHFSDKVIDANHNGIPAGCVVFYGTKQKIIHVVFSIGNGLMIEQGGGGSRTLTETDAMRDNAFSRIRPISRRSDFVCAVDPF